MSAAIIAFPPSAPHLERSAVEGRAEQEAVRQARLIRQSESGASMAIVLALLSVMPRNELERVEAALAEAPDDSAVEEALALVGYATADNERKARVATILGRMGGRPF